MAVIKNSLQTLKGWWRRKVYPQGCWALAWPLKITTDGHSLSVGPDRGHRQGFLPSLWHVHTAQMGATWLALLFGI